MKRHFCDLCGNAILSGRVTVTITDRGTGASADRDLCVDCSGQLAGWLASRRGDLPADVIPLVAPGRPATSGGQADALA